MKKLFLIISLAFCLFAFAGCGGAKSYTGEYGYENYGVKYGVKVQVQVKGDKITGVEILQSDYTAATPEDIWDGKPTWDEGLSALLKSFEGKTVEEIRAINVAVKDDGEPYTTDDGVQVNYGGLVITGATMGSGRLLLAVQNALSNM